LPHHFIVLSLLAAHAIAPHALRAQTTTGLSGLEVGLFGEATQASTPANVSSTSNGVFGGRIGWVGSATPWDVDVSSEFGARRTINGTELREVAAPIRVVRRLGRGSGPRGVNGTYLSAGYAPRRVGEAGNLSSGTLVHGVVGGVGYRVNTGSFGVILPELMVARQASATRNGLAIPAMNTVSMRVSYAVYFCPPR
jgi:hypothetical protein